MTLVAFSVGNIVGSEIFQPKDAPDYIPGKIAIMVLLTVQLAVSFLLRWINLRLNKKKKALVEEIKKQRGWTDEDIQRERNKHAFADLTDKEWVVNSNQQSRQSYNLHHTGTPTSCIRLELVIYEVTES